MYDTSPSIRDHTSSGDSRLCRCFSNYCAIRTLPNDMQLKVRPPARMRKEIERSVTFASGTL